MFFRQLSWLLAYELWDKHLTISKLPVLMNGPGAKMKQTAGFQTVQRPAPPASPGGQASARPDPLTTELEAKRGSLYYGFDAAFVGDVGPGGLGQLPLNSFFPTGMGPLTSKTPVTGCPGRTFGQVIPPWRLGRLFDDVTGFENRPDSGYAMMVLDIDPIDEKAMPVLGPDGNPVVVVRGVDDEIVERAFLDRGTPVDPAEVDGKYVPWFDFVKTCYCAMDRPWIPNPDLRGVANATPAMVKFLGTLNGTVPSRFDDFVFWMTLYHFQTKDKSAFENKVRKAIDDLKVKLHPEGKN
jgi:hypothetical protein